MHGKKIIMLMMNHGFDLRLEKDDILLLLQSLERVTGNEVRALGTTVVCLIELTSRNHAD